MNAQYELLAPAGNLEKLRTAIDYGADAVYTGGEAYSLRTACENFSLDDLAKGVDYAKSYGKAVYLACNCFMRNRDLAEFPDFIAAAAQTGIDACILSDLGTLALVREHAPGLKVHVSTQASVSNYAACMQWMALGASRIILARELSLLEISEIRRRVPESLELETFVHGAVCVSHSGRCLLSNYLTGRSSNLGDCAHSCRWKYALIEERRPGDFYPVLETDTGTFILNAKDLNMIRHLPELMMAGVNSFKIEGRIKSEYYVASIVSAYRRAIDACVEDLNIYTENLDSYYAETCKVSHRAYHTGFFFDNPDGSGQQYENAAYIRDWEVAARVVGYDAIRGLTACTQRNKIKQGDWLEALAPHAEPFSFQAKGMTDAEGRPIFSTPHAQMPFYMDIPKVLPKGTFLRKQTDL